MLLTEPSWLENLGQDVLAALGAAMLSLIVFAITSEARRRRRKERELTYRGSGYGDRIVRLADQLNQSSQEVNDLFRELTEVASQRQSAITRLQGEVKTLEGQERELAHKVKALKDVPLPVAEHFAELVGRVEKRSARRDYLLFSAGVLVTTLIAILLKYFGV
jgi:chromosome segregation ATPase